MSDQTTLSSIDESFMSADVTTTTTPPTGDMSFSKHDPHAALGNHRSGNDKSSARASTPDLDDISGVLGNLNLDLNNDPTKLTADFKTSIFSPQFSPLNQNVKSSALPSTPGRSSSLLLPTQHPGGNDFFASATKQQPRTPNWSGSGSLGTFASQSILPELTTTPQTMPKNSQQFLNFDASANGNVGGHQQFISLTPNAAVSGFGGSSQFNSQGTPFSNTKVNVPSSAPPVRRTSALGFINTRPFMLPGDNGNTPQVQSSDIDSLYEIATANRSSAASINGNGNSNGNGSGNHKQGNVSSSSSSSLLNNNRTPSANPDNTFGPPLLGDTSRRLTYPGSSPNQNPKSSETVDNAISALHPALTNDMLAGTVAGGSIGMGINNNNGSFGGSNSGPSFNNGYSNFQVPPPSAGSSNGGIVHTNNNGSSQTALPLPSSQTVNYPPMNSSISGPQRTSPFGGAGGYQRNNSFGGFGGNEMNKQVNQQQQQQQIHRHQSSQNISQQQQQQQQQLQQQHNNNQRTNLGLNATANVHRKHSSNKRRGEDASKFINASLTDFVNEIYFLCKDQHGCRFLQRQLEIGGSDAATKIFNEIQLNVIELMIDPFGNYLIQKLLERVSEEQRTILVRNASSQFVRIALDPHGTRALQKLVECINSPTEFQIIINSLSSYIVLLSRDLNGNHVVQKCLQRLPPASCDFIFDAACENCVKIAKHRHGCCVLQRCFDHGTPEQCERLSLKVGENCVELSVDPYGNYVVQYVLSMEENRLRTQNDPEAPSKIPNTEGAIQLVIRALSGNLTRMSTHKFGSNVIEKSLRIPTLSPLLINQLLKETTNLKLLLHDAYGNYVLQTSLDVADDASFRELSELLKPFLGEVRNTPHGRRILSKLVSRGGSAAGLPYTNMNGHPSGNGHPNMAPHHPQVPPLDGHAPPVPNGFPTNIWT